MAKSDESTSEERKPKRTRFSLENLSDAFARLTGTQSSQTQADATGEAAETPDELADSSDQLGSEALSPQMIVEGMLFVGKPDGQSISSREMATHIRDVSPREVEELVEQLNQSYASSGAPYRIESEGQGFRFVLEEKFEIVRQRFHGRAREAKLTPPAIEVLSVVAYRQPIDAEEVTRLRGNRSRSILNQLVRRGLLRLDRPEDSPRKPVYLTTDRFNTLFRIGSPQDLPSSEDLDDC